MRGLRIRQSKESSPMPKLPVGKSKPNLFNSVSDDLKLLLHADSLFEYKIGSICRPVTYEPFFTMSLLTSWGTHRTTPLDLSVYKRYGKGQKVARALLVGFGKTNASFLKLQSLGQWFKCGKCQSKLIHTWQEMVHPSSVVLFLFLNHMFVFRFSTVPTSNGTGRSSRLMFWKLRNTGLHSNIYMLWTLNPRNCWSNCSTWFKKMTNLIIRDPRTSSASGA